jgi:hypothetical protein
VGKGNVAVSAVVSHLCQASLSSIPEIQIPVNAFKNAFQSASQYSLINYFAFHAVETTIKS